MRRFRSREIKLGFEDFFYDCYCVTMSSHLTTWALVLLSCHTKGTIIKNTKAVLVFSLIKLTPEGKYREKHLNVEIISCRF